MLYIHNLYNVDKISIDVIFLVKQQVLSVLKFQRNVFATTTNHIVANCWRVCSRSQYRFNYYRSESSVRDHEYDFLFSDYVVYGGQYRLPSRQLATMLMRCRSDA